MLNFNTNSKIIYNLLYIKSIINIEIINIHTYINIHKYIYYSIYYNGDIIGYNFKI